MARIYKEGGSSARSLGAFNRGSIGEFPPKPLMELGLPPPLEPQEASSAQPLVINTEELRQTLLSELRAEAQEKVELAFKEGQRRGFEAGRREFVESTAQAAEALQSAAAKMLEARIAFLKDLETQVLDLVRLICHKVLLREAKADQDLMLSTLHRALEKIADRQHIRVRIAPDDLEALRRHRVTLLEKFPGIEELEVVADPNVSPGGCVVDSNLLHVDARLEVLLRHVLDSLD